MIASRWGTGQEQLSSGGFREKMVLDQQHCRFAG